MGKRDLSLILVLSTFAVGQMSSIGLRMHLGVAAYVLTAQSLVRDITGAYAVCILRRLAFAGANTVVPLQVSGYIAGQHHAHFIEHAKLRWV